MNSKRTPSSLAISFISVLLPNPRFPNSRIWSICLSPCFLAAAISAEIRLTTCSWANKIRKAFRRELRHRSAGRIRRPSPPDLRIFPGRRAVFRQTLSAARGCLCALRRIGPGIFLRRRAFGKRLRAAVPARRRSHLRLAAHDLRKRGRRRRRRRKSEKRPDALRMQSADGDLVDDRIQTFILDTALDFVHDGRRFIQLLAVIGNQTDIVDHDLLIGIVADFWHNFLLSRIKFSILQAFS